MLKTHVSVLVRFNSFGYSGGRYHALMMISALARSGFDVSVYCNAIPEMHREFACNPGYAQIRWCPLDSTIDDHWKSDVVICVPNLGDALDVYVSSLELAIRDDAKLIMIDFETRDWFNSSSDIPRPKSWYQGARELARGCDLILSSTNFGSERAKEYYKETYSERVFDFVYPGINTMKLAGLRRRIERDTIFFPTRIKSAEHKSATLAGSFLKETPAGMRFVMMIDAASADSELIRTLRKEATELGVDLVTRYSITDEEKFSEYLRSRVVVFPTTFEGFGYPLVEAIHCGCQVIAFDLPVFKELTSGQVELCRLGDVDQMMANFREKIAVEPENKQKLESMNLNASNFEIYAAQLSEVCLRPIEIDTSGQRARAVNRLSGFKNLMKLSRTPRRMASNAPKSMHRLLISSMPRNIDQLYSLVPNRVRERIHSLRGRF